MEEIIFPNQIRMYRRLRGKSMQELADYLTMSLSAISKIEKGYRRVDQEQLIKFAEFLDCPIQNLFVNEQSSQKDVVMAWRREQERRNKINEKNGLKTLGAGLRQIRNEKKLTLVEVAENSNMTLSVYHRIEMGQREVSEKEMRNIAKALKTPLDELREQIKDLDEKGSLEEIIQRNDAKYKILSTPRGAISAFDNEFVENNQLSVFGIAADNGNITINFDEEVSKITRPSFLKNKKDSYALKLCTRRLGNLLSSRSILFVDPYDPVTSGDLAVYFVDEDEVKVVSVRENEEGQLYGIRWQPDEKVVFSDDDLKKLHRVVYIKL